MVAHISAEIIDGKVVITPHNIIIKESGWPKDLVVFNKQNEVVLITEIKRDGIVEFPSEKYWYALETIKVETGL